MSLNKGYIKVPLSFNRLAVRASASVTRKRNAIHSFTEVDITEVRKLIRDHQEKTGEKLSLTASGNLSGICHEGLSAIQFIYQAPKADPAG